MRHLHHMRDCPVASVTQFRPPAKEPNGYRMVARAGRGEIYLYGVIGQDFWGEGVSASQFAKDLKALGKVSAIDLRINSDGGSVTEAESMYTHLVEHEARVTVHIDGLAASAASFIAMAGDEILVSDGAFVMIHEARMMSYGTANDFRRGADLLDKVNDRLVAKYAARTKQPDKQLRDWMAAETWFTGAEAVKHGFADKLAADLKVAACVQKPERFTNLPAALDPKRQRVAAAMARIRACAKKT